MQWTVSAILAVILFYVVMGWMKVEKMDNPKKKQCADGQKWDHTAKKCVPTTPPAPGTTAGQSQ